MILTNCDGQRLRDRQFCHGKFFNDGHRKRGSRRLAQLRRKVAENICERSVSSHANSLLNGVRLRHGARCAIECILPADGYRASCYQEQNEPKQS
jgi:hypothetical protein